MRKHLCKSVAGLGLALVCQLSSGFESLRAQEIAQCLPGEVSTWGDGQDRPAISSPMVFIYDHTNAPAWLSQTMVLSAVQKAQVAWSQCGVPGQVVTTTPGTPADRDMAKGALLVQWSDIGSRGNFGLANLRQRTLSLGPTAFQTLRNVNPGHDSRETLQMVISHEMGHLYGLMAHSRRCVDVTSYYDNGAGEKCRTRDGLPLTPGYEYRSQFPTACDIQRCRALNSK